MKALLVVLALFGSAEIVSTDAQKHTSAGDAKLAAGDPSGAVGEYRAAIAADPHAFEARVNLGAALLKTGDTEGAIASLEAARAVRSDSAPLLRNLGRAYLKMEDWEKASEALQSAAGIEPENDEGNRLLGIALARSGQSAQAVPVLAQAVASHPADLELLMELASAQTDAGDPAAKATTDKARKAASSGTEGARLKNNLGLLLRKQGRTADALAEFRAAAKLDPTYGPALADLGMALFEAGDAKGAVGTLIAASRKDDDPEIRFALGQARLATGDAKGAIADLEAARSWGYDPNRIAAALVQCYEAIGEKSKADGERSRAGGAAGIDIADADAKAGVDLLARGNWAAASEKLAKVAAARPDDGAVQFDLALARLHLGDAAGAKDPLERASKALPSEPLVWYHLGVARKELGDRAGAVDAWQNLLKIQPARGDVRAAVGHLLLELDRNDAAVKELEAAEKALPSDPEVKYDLAVGYLRQHDAANAVPVLSGYLSARPDDLPAREAYAQALSESGRTKDAAAEYEKLAKTKPQVARYKVNEAVCWRKAGDAKAEKASLLAAAALAPDDAGVLNDLGRLQFADHEWAAAQDSFRRAAALDPKLVDAANNAEAARKNAEVEAMKASRVHLGVIVVKTKPEMDGALAQIKKGKAAFGDLAKKLSTHDSAKNGGDLGWVDPATLPAWAVAAKELKPGGYSPVVEVPGGFALFYRFPG